MAEKRLIDANALYGCLKVELELTNGLRADVYWRGFNNGLTMAQAVVNQAPTVDAVEVVHGFNTYDHNSAFECSVCGFSDWDTMTADDGKYNYCPSCGAKMDGERRTDG